MADKIDQLKIGSTSYDIALPPDSNEILNFAPAFSSSTAYSVGDYVTYDGSLWKCTTAHSAAAWNASHFTKVTVQPILTITDLR